MEKKNIGLGVAALAAGAGAVALAAKNHKDNVKNEVKKAAANASEQEYRNTERGKNEKNSKGIYYTNGNYEAFARPEKPEGIEEKSAYLVGSGLAALAAACGMAAVFCGVTNCPITALLISFELFGYDGMPYFLLAVAFSYMLSGYYGLYSSQKIIYSKYKTNYINRKTH